MNATENAQATAPNAMSAGAAATAAAAADEARRNRVRLGIDAEAMEAAELPKPKTITVLGVLVCAALLLSYLGSYAFTNALLSAEVIKPWAEGQDPRPKWLLFSFVGLLTVFCLLAIVFRFLSRRQLASIDETANAEEISRISEL
jgi:hypothetical protein